MKEIGRIYCFFFTLLFMLLSISDIYAQDKSFFGVKYNASKRQAGNQSFYAKVLKISKNGNSVNFPYLSYSIDSRNIMFKGTKDIAFLEENFVIISNILKSSLNSESRSNAPNWKANSTHIKYKEVNNTEVILYEGYLFRYIAEYCYIVSKYPLSKMDRKRLTIDKSVLEGEFLKWYDFSMEKRKDDSYLQGIRTHMGSHWATIAMYLYLLSDNEINKKIYHEVFSRFDIALRNNFKKNTASGVSYYVWNSTWDYPFTNQQKERKSKGQDKATVQDVTHGNHVVQYIIDSHNLGFGKWTATDLLLLSNTLKYHIWDSKTERFSDLVNGNNTDDKSLRGTGWKQSDGWMKLMKYDNSLKKIYLKYYAINKNRIDSSYLNSQFYSVFYSNL